MRFVDVFGECCRSGMIFVFGDERSLLAKSNGFFNIGEPQFDCVELYCCVVIVVVVVRCIGIANGVVVLHVE